MKYIAIKSHESWTNEHFDEQNTLKIANDADLAQWTPQVQTAERIELVFPKFNDGRAFTQAHVLRMQLDFKGDICATGDVLIDQLLQMQRCGFSSANLRADQNAEHGQKLLTQFSGFYQ